MIPFGPVHSDLICWGGSNFQTTQHHMQGSCRLNDGNGFCLDCLKEGNVSIISQATPGTSTEPVPVLEAQNAFTDLQCWC